MRDVPLLLAQTEHEIDEECQDVEKEAEDNGQ
jgi:hypothetical protein